MCIIDTNFAFWNFGNNIDFKLGVFIGDYGNMEYRKLFKADQDVKYMEGETSERLRQ